MKTILKEHWDRIFFTLGNTLNLEYCEVTFEILFNNYFFDERRHYHDAQHIRYCLDSLVELREHFIKTNSKPKEAVNYTALEIAIWFHDFIYDTKKNDNEKMSALAGKQFVLGLTGDSSLAEKVESLILFTKHDRKANTDEEKIISDVDLLTLGDYPSSYRGYSRNIRAEYNWAPDYVYYPGRLKILESLNSRYFIFYNEVFRKPDSSAGYDFSYEDNARANIRNEIREINDKLK